MLVCLLIEIDEFNAHLRNSFNHVRMVKLGTTWLLCRSREETSL